MSKTLRNFFVLLGLAALAIVVGLYIRDHQHRIVSNGSLTDYAVDDSGNLYLIEGGKLYHVKSARAGSIIGSSKRELSVSDPEGFVSGTDPLVVVRGNDHKCYLLDPEHRDGYRPIGEYPRAVVSPVFSVADSNKQMICWLQLVSIPDADSYSLIGILEVMNSSGQIRNYEVSDPSVFRENQIALSAECQRFVYLSESHNVTDDTLRLNVLDLVSGETRSLDILTNGRDASLLVNDGHIAVTKMASGVMVFDLELNLLMERSMNCSLYPPFEDSGVFLVIENSIAVVGLDLNGKEVLREVLDGQLEDYIIGDGSLYLGILGEDSHRRFLRVDTLNHRLETVMDMQQDSARNLSSGADISSSRLFVRDISGNLHSFALDD
ncbi:hypothetical protein KDL44_09030 [bacterium]|nr:hypothetical protein [bacterium]